MGAADGTKARAVRPAQRRQRQREHHCVPQRRLKIDQSVVDDRAGLLVAVAGVGEQLLEVGGELLLDRVEAPDTLADGAHGDIA